MTAPTTFDFAIIQIGTGPSTYVNICGINTTGLNQTAQTRSDYVRDCDNPALVPAQMVTTTGKSFEISGSGVANSAQILTQNGVVGIRVQYRVLIKDISDPANQTGSTLGYWQGQGVCTALNMGTPNGGQATVSITIASHGNWTYTAGAPS